MGQEVNYELVVRVHLATATATNPSDQHKLTFKQNKGDNTS